MYRLTRNSTGRRAIRLALLTACLAVAVLRHGVADDLAGAGDPARGATLIAKIGCGACHSIPGVAGANGRVGPPLDNIGERTIIAGLLANTPANLVTWLKSPQSIVPGNAMPNMGLNDHDAQDIAAYLETLR